MALHGTASDKYDFSSACFELVALPAATSKKTDLPTVICLTSLCGVWLVDPAKLCDLVDDFCREKGQI